MNQQDALEQAGRELQTRVGRGVPIQKAELEGRAKELAERAGTPLKECRPSDYCYNRNNDQFLKKLSPKKLTLRAMFRYVENGLYEFLGVGYPSALSEKTPILRKLNREVHQAALQMPGDGRISPAANALHVEPIITDRDVSPCWSERCDTNF